MSESAKRAAAAILQWGDDDRFRSLFPPDVPLDQAAEAVLLDFADSGIPITRETVLAYFVGMEQVVHSAKIVNDKVDLASLLLLNYRVALEVVRPFLVASDFGRDVEGES